jgi:hypothetical protein
MLRYILCTALLLALLIGSAHADNSRDGNLFVAHGSGLACFSQKSSLSPTGAWSKGPTCDDLCAEKHAACTGVEITDSNAVHANPVACNKPPLPAFTDCRCCAASR